MFIRFCFLNLVLQQYCLTESVWKLATIAILFSPYSLHKCLVLQISDRGHYELKAECWEEFDPLFGNYYLNELEEAQVKSVLE
jgi:hypothetical protein